MSGLCGWVGHGAGAADNRVLVEAMAAPLARFDASPVHTAQGSRSAAAVVAQPGSAHLHQQDGLTVALWGDVRVRDAALAEQVAEQGLARVLAGRWRDGPQAVCEALSGAFALCIIDEAAGEALLAIGRASCRERV